MRLDRSTAHTADALRWLLTGPAGTAELRITPAYAVLIIGGEAEVLPGEEIATLWQAADCDDAVVWAELERACQPAPADPGVDPAIDPRFAELRAAAAWASAAEQLGDQADVEQAHAEHMAALRRLIACNR